MKPLWKDVAGISNDGRDTDLQTKLPAMCWYIQDSQGLGSKVIDCIHLILALALLASQAVGGCKNGHRLDS